MTTPDKRNPCAAAEADTIEVTINQTLHRLPAGATLIHAIEHIGVRPPFAAAVNLEFVPRSRHREHRLAEGDRIELIAPITGG